ncbi:MAG: DNA-directed RNA polymerase subunit alpha C-terminal domain-containing protein [Thermoguttaceae bacterium]|jgi:DNA-directed RNA polymerase subunit alpha
MATRVPLIKTDRDANDLSAKLQMSTAEIGLSVRTTNCLEEKGIFTVEDLLRSPPEELLSITNFGEKTLEEVYLALEGIGFYRKARRACPAARKRADPPPHPR